jgi:hypothetical protein
MPPQQRKRLLDLIDDVGSFGTHPISPEYFNWRQ